MDIDKMLEDLAEYYDRVASDRKKLASANRALENIAGQFAGIAYDELSTAEHACLRSACIELGWSIATDCYGQVTLNRG